MTVWSNSLQKRRHKNKVDSLGYLKFAVANSFRMKKLKLRRERKQKQKDVQRQRLEDRAGLSYKRPERFTKSTPVFQCTKYNSETKERTLEADKANLPKSEKTNVRRNILHNISNFNYNRTSQTPRSDLVRNIIENNNNNSATELLLSNGNNSVTKYNIIDPETRHKMKLLEIKSQIKSNSEHFEKLFLLKQRLQNKTF